jgi:hypothetical protein
MYGSTPTIDATDEAIVARRMASIATLTTPRVGDFVRFSDGTERRISYLWPDGAQTSDGGSFYLGNYGGNFSGSLHPTVPLDSLMRTDEVRDGTVWIFHHDQHRAHNGVHFSVPFRVYECSLPAPR